jgi:oligopeptide/dipeptide ABC transporter ATP-binding protein
MPDQLNNDPTTLEVKNLSVSFFTKQGEVRVINDLSYKIPQGKVLGIVGESGCGKSVTAYTVMGLLAHPGKIVQGSINFEGRNLAQITNSQFEDLRGNSLSMIFQEPLTALNPVLRVGEQIQEQILRHRSCSPQEAKDRSIELLQLVGIPAPQKRYENYPHEMSGGMKQRSMIAMALSCDPKLLIADEPTTALDVTIQAQIIELIQSLQERFSMAVQFITHDLGVISEISDHVLVMYAGRAVEYAPSEELFRAPRHPYTRGLMNSLPRLKKPGESLYAIPGEVPSPLLRLRGCAFKNRCQFATEQCHVEMPILQALKENPVHQVSCFNPVMD